MPKQTPLEEVRARFGSKEELANQLLPILERDEDVDEEEWGRRIRTASNKQLLRLHHTHEVVSKQFGSKEKLVDALVRRKFPNGNEPYATKLMSLRPTRLVALFQAAR